MENQDQNSNADVQERVLLMAINVNQDEEMIYDLLDELEELTKTAGGTVIMKVVQNRHHYVPGTYLGKGKIEEMKESIQQHAITTVICDDELTPVQLKNLKAALEVTVIDRTILILDIFAKHAHTKEGILQVELAQHQYRLSRLTGLGESMSRLGAGIGTRGPGEKKLETDRRHIRLRIGHLKTEMEKIAKNRNILRENRRKQGKPVIAIVGYTNAGKSTLLNQLTQAGVLEEDQLFATLDPTTRKLVMPEGTEVMVTDTVGFIRKLPHHLVEAFKSTLEEAVYADILLHVVDAANPEAHIHMEVVYETLQGLGASEKKVLTVFNKMDQDNADAHLKDVHGHPSVRLSAKTGEGIEDLLSQLDLMIHDGKRLIKTVIPYQNGKILDQIRTFGQLKVERYEAEGTYIEAYLEEAYIQKFGL